MRGSRFGLFEDGGTLWRITIALLLAALIAIGIAFMRADRYSGAAAFILSLVAVVMLAWDHCRRTLALLAASAQDRNLDIAIQVDPVLGKALQRAQEEARAAKPGSRSTVAGRCESLLRAAFRERPLLPRLVGRLFASTSLAVLASVVFFGIMAMSIALANCAGGICQAVYDHSCLSGESPTLSRFLGSMLHFLHYQTVSLYGMGEVAHHPVSRGAHALTIATSLTWLFYLVWVVGGQIAAIFFMESRITPGRLLGDAMTLLAGDLAMAEREPAARAHRAGA